MFEIMPFDRRSYRMSYNPFRELEQMEKNFWGDQQVNPFRTDISETADGYKLEADLPGFRKEDIHIDIDDDILSIHAEHKDSKGEKDDKGDYIRRERYYGSYSRSFNVSEIDVEGIKAAYENGVLTLRRSEDYWNGTARAEIVELHFGCDDLAAALENHAQESPGKAGVQAPRDRVIEGQNC